MPTHATVADRLREYFEARPAGTEPIACAWLFGSVARGTARRDSDVDVAVLMARDPDPTLTASGVVIASELEGLLHRPVDVVQVNRAPVDLVHRVLRDGILVYEADRPARVRFEVRVRKEWLDLKPMLDQYRRKPGAARG